MTPSRAALAQVCGAGLGAAVLLAGPVAAQQVCDTRSYALSAPTSRYADNADGTVTDKELQLMWTRCSMGQRSAGAGCAGQAARYGWPAAQALVAEVNRSGDRFFSDWRLPSVRELATIAERQCSAPRINLAVFPGTPPAAYWTSTARPGAGAGTSSFAISFGSDGVQLQDNAEALHVRLVRNAP